MTALCYNKWHRLCYKIIALCYNQYFLKIKTLTFVIIRLYCVIFSYYCVILSMYCDIISISRVILSNFSNPCYKMDLLCYITNSCVIIR